MTNLLIPFECPICGSDGFTQVYVKGRDGSSRLTQAYGCLGCSTMFRERERFTKRRLTVMGRDGIDLKPTVDKKRSGGRIGSWRYTCARGKLAESPCRMSKEAAI